MENTDTLNLITVNHLQSLFKLLFTRQTKVGTTNLKSSQIFDSNRHLIINIEESVVSVTKVVGPLAPEGETAIVLYLRKLKYQYS
jgi:hypothetical protein